MTIKNDSSQIFQNRILDRIPSGGQQTFDQLKQHCRITMQPLNSYDCQQGSRTCVVKRILRLHHYSPSTKMTMNMSVSNCLFIVLALRSESLCVTKILCVRVYLKGQQANESSEALCSHEADAVTGVTHTAQHRYHQQNDVGHDVHIQLFHHTWRAKVKESTTRNEHAPRTIKLLRLH